MAVAIRIFNQLLQVDHPFNGFRPQLPWCKGITVTSMKYENRQLFYLNIAHPILSGTSLPAAAIPKYSDD